MSYTEERNKVEKSLLYLVATPIGNLADITERALKVLSEVDFVAAEDTRNSGLLLSRLGIKKPMISYHDHNRTERGPEIVERLKGGESCALISDAGMPAISDPGEELVALCAREGIRVSIIPGACAAVSALALSGLSTRRFAFEGFLPVSGKERKKRLTDIAKDERTLIIYEAPHRLKKTLAEFCEYFGSDRRIALCRELTKLNEEIIRMTLAAACEYYESVEPRGEYVLVIDGAPEATEAEESVNIADRAAALIAGGMSQKDAIKTIVKETGLPKNKVYAEVLKIGE
ncbi:MAG: 16S rRNA (cytidine(1402)-2'-O)-methyltransferase [Clostridia bacterium]|nr:16S rRNA (cytidine(1402)-2'-O)-methyltransferase [Clostridia bacterium]